VVELLLAAALAAPTKGHCANAWNRHATAAQRAAVERAHVRVAHVAVGEVFTDTFSKTHGSTSTSARGCTILFFDRSRTLSAFGAWRRGTVPRWTGPLAGRAQPRPTLDLARVAADGTVHVR